MLEHTASTPVRSLELSGRIPPYKALLSACNVVQPALAVAPGCADVLNV